MTPIEETTTYLRRVIAESLSKAAFAATIELDNITAVLTEIESLRAIIAKLPVTADGVPVVPYVDDVFINKSVYMNCGWVRLTLKERFDPIGLAMVPFYSTRAAADAAKEK